MRVCSTCGRVASEEDSFCSRCGSALAESHGQERRSLVTVVFADLAGSTALGERLDAEVLRSVQARYFAACARAAQAHGGQVEKFIGDAAMAVFGLPRVREDDALRACRAALDLVAGVDALSAELDREVGLRLQVRVGVHSGEVVAGDPARGQALVTGDAVNTAARLEQSAGPGEVRIGKLTYELAAAALLAEPIAPVVAKGKRDPVPAYRLLGLREVTRGTDSIFVGREHDLAALREAFSRVTTQRRGETIVVVGEAGIGKSRLVAQFVAGVPPRTRVAFASCLSYGEDAAARPVKDVVDALTAGREQQLLELLGGAGPADPLLRTVGSQPGTAYPQAVSAALVALVRAAAQEPIVVVVEDLHWADPALLALFTEAAEALHDVPVLLLGTARTEVASRLGPGRRLVLPPLDRAAAIAVLAARGTAPERRSALVDAAGGNPMYLEQLEAAGDAPEQLPPTLRALLTARIDRLALRDREVLDTAAVAGREFWPAGLLPLLDERGREELPARLASLTDAELIAPGRADAPPDLELRLSGVFGATGRYAFRHALIQEAAYASLPKARAAALHERFALVLQRERPGNPSPAVAAWHLARAAALRAELRPRPT